MKKSTSISIILLILVSLIIPSFSGKQEKNYQIKAVFYEDTTLTYSMYAEDTDGEGIVIDIFNTKTKNKFVLLLLKKMLISQIIKVEFEDQDTRSIYDDITIKWTLI